MNMHARTLRYFDMIRRCGSIREAARRLSIDSSALNRQLLALEREVKVQLFERLRNGLKLTSAGEIFSRHAIAVLQDEQRTAEELKALKGNYRGKLAIMSSEGLNADLLPEVLARMSAQYPQVAMQIHSAVLARNTQPVLDGDVDVALGFGLSRNDGLHQVALGQFRMGAIMCPSHQLAAKKDVRFSQCAEYGLILSSPELPIHDEMRPILLRHKRPLRVMFETASVGLARSMAARTMAIAFQTRLGMERELREKKLVYVPLADTPHIFSELGVYVRAGRSLPPAVDAFIQLLKAEITTRERGAVAREKRASPGDR
jgi:DNA-binding transcriptional LysR family regulator